MRSAGPLLRLATGMDEREPLPVAHGTGPLSRDINGLEVAVFDELDALRNGTVSLRRSYVGAQVIRNAIVVVGMRGQERRWADIRVVEDPATKTNETA